MAVEDIQDSTLQVLVRVRPLNYRERDEGQRVCVYNDEQTKQIVLAAVDKQTLVQLKGSTARGYAFDRRYTQEHTGSDIYYDVGQKLVQNCFKGYNATILAYGQTGSGKTFTMAGGVGIHSVSEKGIIPQIIEQVYETTNAIRRRLKPGEEIEISASALEIYNEDIKDLATIHEKSDLSKNKESLQIRERPTGRFGRVTAEVQGLSEQRLNNYEDMMRYFNQCMENRSVSTTKLNDCSSRSHAIFTISINRVVIELLEETDANYKAKVRTESFSSKLHLVDLAGSERVKRSGVSGKELKEASHINSGLLALGNVISALSDEQQHIPYRSSKLTRLLQDSLGGNSLTVLITCISPSESDFEETNNTLKYANRACKIKNQPLPNNFVMLEEDLLPSLPTGSNGTVPMFALLNDHLRQRELRDKRELDKLERDRRNREFLIMARTEQFRTPGIQRLRAAEYDRKLKEARSKGRNTFGLNERVIQLTEDQMEQEQLNDLQQGVLNTNTVSSTPTRRGARGQGFDFNAFVKQHNNQGVSSSQNNLQDDVRQSNNNNFKNRLLNSNQQGRGRGRIGPQTQRRNLINQHLYGKANIDQQDEDSQLEQMQTDGEEGQQQFSNYNQQQDQQYQQDQYMQQSKQDQPQSNIINGVTSQRNSNIGQQGLQQQVEQTQQSSQDLDSQVRQNAKDFQRLQVQQRPQAGPSEPQVFDIAQANKSILRPNNRLQPQPIPSSSQPYDHTEQAQTDSIGSSNGMPTYEVYVPQILARFKVNKYDVVSVFKAVTEEDLMDVVRLLPENTALPASDKMTYLVARLEHRDALNQQDWDINERIDLVVKGKMTMTEGVGPTVGCLMATFGTNMISSCIFDFSDPEELEDYTVEERIELWGLQIPHNSVRPSLIEQNDINNQQQQDNDQQEGEQHQQQSEEQKIQWTSIDRLNMSVGLLYALCYHANQCDIRCGFCVPRPQLLRRWQQAGVRMRQVSGELHLIYPDHAHDYEYYKSSTVAYFVVENVVESLQKVLSLLPPFVQPKQ